MDIKAKALREIEKVKSLLNSEGLVASAISEKPYNYEVEIVSVKEKIKVQVYFGKKGIKKVIQGNMESELYQKINGIITNELILKFPNPVFDEPDNYIGSDESGKGDIFGPLVTAAVHVTTETIEKLDKLGVRDSKDLSENQITELAYLIEKTIGQNYEIVLITPAKYNELYKKFKNLNKLLNWSHSKAIENLLARTNCQTVITDKFEKKNLSIAGTGKGMNIKFIQTPKAERFTAVAAASILARNAFNRWFISQRKTGYDLPKGASEHVALKAGKIYRQSGEEILNNLAKMHFKTIKKIKLQ